MVQLEVEVDDALLPCKGGPRPAPAACAAVMDASFQQQDSVL